MCYRMLVGIKKSAFSLLTQTFFVSNLLSSQRAEPIIAKPAIHEMAAQAAMPSCWVNPATTNVRNDTRATVRA